MRFSNYEAAFKEIKGYMSKCSIYLEDDDIEMITREISQKLDEVFKEAGKKELSQENLRELLRAVKAELAYATYSIPQEDINRMSNEIVKKVAQIYMDEDYREKIDELTNEMKIVSEYTYSESDIKKIAASIDWTEEELSNLIKDNLKVTDDTLKNLSNDLNISVNELTKLIAENKNYTDSLYLSLSDTFNMDPSTIKKLMETSERTSSASSSIFA